MDVVKILLLTLGGGLEHALNVYRQLKDLQLEIVEGGNVLINGIYVVGKGTNSVVFKCRPEITKNVELACKLRRGDSTRSSFAPEGQFLHLANTVGVGPEVYAYYKDIVIYRYIDGIHIDTWWREASPEKKRIVVEELMSQAYKLDKIGLSHNELSRLEKHVLIERDLPVIIDFESATLGSRNNVTQVSNGLMRLGLKPPTESLRTYKRCLCIDAFKEILRFFLDQL